MKQKPFPVLQDDLICLWALLLLLEDCALFVRVNIVINKVSLVGNDVYDCIF